MSSEGSEQPDIPEGIMFSPRRAADLHHDAVVSRALQQELARIDELHGGPLNKNFGVEDLFDSTGSPISRIRQARGRPATARA
jgi:hypothetical protein